MSDDDELDPSDWLASQFETKANPVVPPTPDAPAAAPAAPVFPTQPPPATVPPLFPPPPLQQEPQLPYSPPPSPQLQPGVPAQPSFPAEPSYTLPPSFPAPPVAPVAPVAPAAPAAPVSPLPPATAGGAFQWGLTPGGETPAPEPAPYVPPAPYIPDPAPFIPLTPEPPAYAAPGTPKPPFTPEPALAPESAFDAPTTAFPAPHDTPTTAFSQQAVEPLPLDATQWLAAPIDASLDGVTEVLEAELVGNPVPEGEGLEPSALDSLFGEQQFTDYAGQSMIQVPPPRLPGGDKPKKDRVPGGPIPRNQKILMWVAGGLVAALALVALFLVGTRLSAAFGPSPALAPSPSPSPSASGKPLGPVPPGEYQWDALLGGECIQPFESAWQDRYVVIDCTKPHAAQMVYRGEFPEDPVNPLYPGLDELQKRINLLCTAPTIINYAVAGTAKDIEVSASFAVDSDDWDDGNREFYCFVTRTGGVELLASVAVPQVAPTPTPLPSP